MQSALRASIDEGAEGVMIKLTGRRCEGESIASVPLRSYGYEAGTRSHLWLKLKRDYVAGFSDTIDVVPVGAWFGNGRKAQKGFLSPILLAVYDEDDGTFQSISRCMSFSDKMYAAMREFYLRGTPYPDDDVANLVEGTRAIRRTDATSLDDSGATDKSASLSDADTEGSLVDADEWVGRKEEDEAGEVSDRVVSCPALRRLLL